MYKYGMENITRRQDFVNPINWEMFLFWPRIRYNAMQRIWKANIRLKSLQIYIFILRDKIKVDRRVFSLD